MDELNEDQRAMVGLVRDFVNREIQRNVIARQLIQRHPATS
jgi:hypothetical protein